MYKLNLSFIKTLKQKIISSRYIVARLANIEMLKLYYSVGQMIEFQAKTQDWGSKVLETVTQRLQQELPGLRGFSAQNMKKMRVFYNAWKNYQEIDFLLSQSERNEIGSTLSNQIENEIGSTVSNQIETAYNINIKQFLELSFSHHYELITKTESIEQRAYYISRAASEYLGVRDLKLELKNKSFEANKSFLHNFNSQLSENQSDKAIKVFKDQYLLDFVNIEDADEEIDEKVLEQSIVNNIKKFMMSLGPDFSFMGNQYKIIVSDQEFFIDLVFFHRGLQSIIAIELKRGKFKPEYAGKMNFYLSALDDLVKKKHENPSIGIILCKEKNNNLVEYTIKGINKPLGVGEYKTTKELPVSLRNILPDAQTLKKLMDY
ncbi:MAG: PDDEXK nuclease domain-containing protein [Marinifilaceae bacterium]|jgi:predicted nuclease of restriction endonuclease-like (RecB) superfamily|nr:PDDEXK nuclease domain-containing protein [Marinifilaceae bacterium]